ncbi:hypothetical protein [Micromonospora eburnea]|uniref:YbaB/EbfC DNA-binding family protein n=1 Tax=Micromonospora eburnea TaxID=227316 RepID=A0A1C6UX17_9ACTN|nr:hypothetical protein [Micromonospora eburnea]SCL58349.1 hypothetical protein GA0070604_3813 [Micromonospora eburnea]
MQRDRRNVRLSLASLDVLGSDSELRAQVEHAMREAESRPMPDAFAGHDRTGTITVRVNAAGQVEDVSIGRDWRTHLGLDGAAQALFAAYMAAVQATLEAVALQALQRDRSASPPAAQADADEVDEHLWLRHTWRTLHEIDADLERLTHAQPPQAEETISSPQGSLTLHVRGGSVTAITGDVARLARLDASQLRYEAIDVLRAFDLAHPRNGEAPA